MKKNLLFVMGAMLLLMGSMVITACSSDEEEVTSIEPETEHATRRLPKQADYVKTVTDIGYLMCDKEDNTWIIHIPVPDAPGEMGTLCFLFDLPEEY